MRATSAFTAAESVTSTAAPFTAGKLLLQRREIGVVDVQRPHAARPFPCECLHDSPVRCPALRR